MTTTSWSALTVGATAIVLAAGLTWPQLATAVNVAVVTGTLIAVFWYAVETRRLVQGQERGSELARHPWLKATNLHQGRFTVDDAFPFGGYDTWLPIKNVGLTPALGVEIETTVTVRDPVRDHPETGKGHRGEQVLVTGDTWHAQIAKLVLEGPYTTFEIHATIAYHTIDNGRGQLQVGFTYNAEQGWRNLPTRYDVWLSDGTRLAPGWERAVSAVK